MVGEFASSIKTGVVLVLLQSLDAQQMLAVIGPTSGPSSLDNRVKSFELDPCIGGGELPIDSLACRIAFLLPSSDLTP